MEHGYTAEMTLLKKNPQSFPIACVANAESISTRSEARCSMRNVLMHSPAPPVEPIRPVQLVEGVAGARGHQAGVARPVEEGRRKPADEPIGLGCAFRAVLYAASIMRTCCSMT
jgi:hypothetical protein